MASSDKAIHERILKIQDELNSIDEKISNLKRQARELQAEKALLQERLDRRVQQANNVESLASWETESFSWSSELSEKLKSIFGMNSFRPLQLSAMNAILSGCDVLLTMSTGGGKSLTYQLPAVLGNTSQFTLVVSPLVSLMEDQVISLNTRGIEAVLLYQHTPPEEMKRILAEMNSPGCKFRLLYVTPERLAKSKRFMAKLEKAYQAGLLKLIAIDEVHCCSQWGHDFRPDYKFLSVLRRQFPDTPILGLTATATVAVLQDIKEILNIPMALEFRASFNRPNLFYQVQQKPDRPEELLQIVCKLLKGQFSGQSGIIYCFSKKDSETFAQNLRTNGVKAEHYHADMDPNERGMVHRKWLSNKCQVIVATVAFGMGIDKADVRFVIHLALPKSVENYYQESGRAGRDGQPASCLLYFGFADLFRLSVTVCNEKNGLENLYKMLAYCTGLANCRRRYFADHFDEQWKPTWCQSACDNCQRPPGSVHQQDVVQQCKMALAILGASGERKFTALKLIDTLCKSEHSLKVDQCKPMLELILVHMLLEGYLKEAFHFTPYSIISYLIPGLRDLGDDEPVIVQFPEEICKQTATSTASSRKRKSEHTSPLYIS
ncbi:putative ATP-dependent DNA helicase Q1 [Trichinella sp. T8]|nr:putative ATP-dependent DNA helicase Q1 [Trichinella sp. T8]